MAQDKSKRILNLLGVDSLFAEVKACELCRCLLRQEDIRTPVFVDGVRKIVCAGCGGKYCENCRSTPAAIHLENELFGQPFLVCKECSKLFLKKGTLWHLVSLWSSVRGAFTV